MISQRPSLGIIRFLRVSTLTTLTLARTEQSKKRVYHVFISLDVRVAAEIPLAVGPRKV